MKIFITLALLFTTSTALAAECEPVLNNFVKIIYSKNDLSQNKNNFDGKLNSADFHESCTAKLNGVEYTLYPHKNDVTIFVKFKDQKSGKLQLKGPFYSAYRK